MSFDEIIRFENVFKKFSKSTKQYGTLRDELMLLFSKEKNQSGLKPREFWAIENLSLAIKKGESIGLYGPNGSGKSTLLKLIASVISPTFGKITINGRIAPLIELGAGFHPDLNGIENIYMNGAILGMSIGEIKSKLATIVEYSELGDFISTPVKKYSSGMKLRLGFSVAIFSQADVYLFDEILAVGDAEFREKSSSSIKELSKKGKTMIIVSHNRPKLESMTHRIFEIDKGRIADGV